MFRLLQWCGSLQLEPYVSFWILIIFFFITDLELLNVFWLMRVSAEGGFAEIWLPLKSRKAYLYKPLLTKQRVWARTLTRELSCPGCFTDLHSLVPAQLWTLGLLSLYNPVPLSPYLDFASVCGLWVSQITRVDSNLGLLCQVSCVAPPTLCLSNMIRKARPFH